MSQQPNPYGPPTGHSYVQKSTPGEAATAMVLGIVGIIFNLLICLPIGLILGPIAIIMGNKAKKKIQANHGTPGQEVATAGIVTGWIATVLGILSCLVIVLYIVFIVVMISQQGSF